MANSSDEEFNSDNDSTNLNPLRHDFPFQSDQPIEEDKAETTPNLANAEGPPCVLELTPITASASAQDNSTNTAETCTTPADMEARQGLSGQLDISLTPPGTPWMPAASSSFYGQQASPIPVLNAAPRRKNRRRVPDHFLEVELLPKKSDDEVEVKAPKKDPRFVLPGAIREREEREDSEMDEATRGIRGLRSEFVSELLMSSMTSRITRADFEKLSGRFGTKNKKK